MLKTEYIVQGRYGNHGWEDLTSHATRKEAIAERKIYDINETGVAHRVIARREKRALVSHTEMQAITTRYICPTNTRGSKVKATCEAGSMTLRWDDGLNASGNHNAAALALATKLKWTDHSRLVGGVLPGSNGHAFVLISRRSR